MEIGQKTTQKTTKIDSFINNSSLSIHINESWVIFCLFNHQKLSSLNKVRFLHKKKSNFILKTIRKYIKSFSKEDIPSEVKLIYYNKLDGPPRRGAPTWYHGGVVRSGPHGGLAALSWASILGGCGNFRVGRAF